MRFNSSHNRHTIGVHDKPSIFISRITFHTGDINWANRLFGATLSIRFECYDEGNNKMVYESEEQIVLGSLLSSHHRMPIFEVNRPYSYIGNSKDVKSKHWEVIFTLNNLFLSPDELFDVSTFDSDIVDDVIAEIETLKSVYGNYNSTQEILPLIPYFRLDWSQDNNEFSAEFDIGVTKPILLTGLVDNEHKMKKSNLLFLNSKFSQLLVNTFFIERKLTLEILKEIHLHLIRGGGEFRNLEVTVIGNDKTIDPPFAKASEVIVKLEALVAWYNIEAKNSNMHPLVLSTFFHHIFVKTHPFLDGNGRMARVITSLILLSSNIPPPISNHEDRSEYLYALRNADSGNIKPLMIFIGNRIIKSMFQAATVKRNSNE